MLFSDFSVDFTTFILPLFVPILFPYLMYIFYITSITCHVWIYFLYQFDLAFSITNITALTVFVTHITWHFQIAAPCQFSAIFWFYAPYQFAAFLQLIILPEFFSPFCNDLRLLPTLVRLLQHPALIFSTPILFATPTITIVTSLTPVYPSTIHLFSLWLWKPP